MGKKGIFIYSFFYVKILAKYKKICYTNQAKNPINNI